jgi:hypothetical protein
MQKKVISFGLLLVLFISVLFPNTIATNGEPSWWDKNWNYREKIDLTSLNDLDKFNLQPIDVKIDFKNKCWTINEKETSVRVCQWDGIKWNELESQIYDLEYSQSTDYINGCNVIFLIPEDSTGKEKYYVYYDDQEKTTLNYIDRVGIEENFLNQEPIPGQKIDVKFYAIRQGDEFIYYVAQEGTLLGESLSQNVVKLKDGTKKIRPDSLEKMAQFCYSYFYGTGDNEVFSTAQKLVSKKIEVDGNLMVRFTIVSESSDGGLVSTNTYSYYYCPTYDKKIRVHVTHEVLKDIYVNDCVEFWDGSYGTLTSFKFRSKAIKDFNFGSIEPYVYVYSEDDSIKEYSLDLNPFYEEPKRYLKTDDDMHLGKQAWVAFDGAEKTHAIILASNKDIVKQGRDEKDGIQVKGFQVELINIPGLEGDFTQAHLMRNAFKNDDFDRSVPDDLIVEYDAEFFTSGTIDYDQMEKESTIFQSLKKLNPSDDKEDGGEDLTDFEKYNLEIYAHQAKSFPLGNLLSILTGRNLSYITVELFAEGDLVSIGAASRVKTESDLIIDGESKNLVEKLGFIADVFDLRNTSFFKKIEFQKLPPGTYVAKIYRENPLLKQKQREFIGLGVVELNEDVEKHIFCTREGNVQLSLLDQNNQGVKNAKASVFLDDVCIVENITDENGLTKINIPYLSKSHPYNLKVTYNGFNIFEESFSLRYFRLNKPLEFSVEIPLYTLKTKIVDIFGFFPGVKLNPTIESLGSTESNILNPTDVDDNIFWFENLNSAEYKINIDYKAFTVEKNIAISSNNEIEIVFPAKYEMKTHIFDSYGLPLSESKVSISRNGKKLQEKTNKTGVATFAIPPGEYVVKSFENEIKTILSGDQEVDLITDKDPAVLSYVQIISAVFLLGIIIIYLTKRISFYTFIKSIPIVLLTSALVMPWWQLNGSAPDISFKHSANTYPYSQKIISKTIYNGDEFLGISTTPDIVNQFLFAVLSLTILCIVFIIFTMILEKLEKHRVSEILAYLSIIFLALVMILFLFGMNELSAVGIGSICGEGDITVNFPYSADLIDINASWCMAIGFYLCIISIAILILAVINQRFKIINLNYFNKIL